MIFSLENSIIKITACTYGGELHSLTSKKDGTDYLWNGNPEYWEYHAPILFPIIGKVIKSKYKIDGKTYELPAHGLTRTSEFKLLSKSDNFITFELKYTEYSLKLYPYKFSLNITYTLQKNSVKVTYTVINLDNKEIYFSIGAHPAFMCPIGQNEILENYYLKFNKKETSSIMKLSKDGYLSYERNEIFKNTDIMKLSKEIFKNGALIFDNLKSDKIQIKNKNNNKSLSIEFKGFPYIGIWAPKSGAPFVCIEPWFGHTDYEDFNGEFKDREGTLSVKVGEKFSCSYRIIIND